MLSCSTRCSQAFSWRESRPKGVKRNRPGDFRSPGLPPATVMAPRPTLCLTRNHILRGPWITSSFAARLEGCVSIARRPSAAVVPCAPV